MQPDRADPKKPALRKGGIAYSVHNSLHFIVLIDPLHSVQMFPHVWAMFNSRYVGEGGRVKIASAHSFWKQRGIKNCNEPDWFSKERCLECLWTQMLTHVQSQAGHVWT